MHNILPCEHTTLCSYILLLTDIQVVSTTWPLLTVVATMNMRGQVCLWGPESNSFGCTWVWNFQINGSFLFLFFFEESPYCFPQLLYQFTFSSYYCYYWHHCLWKGSVTMEIFHWVVNGRKCPGADFPSPWALSFTWLEVLEVDFFKTQTLFQFITKQYSYPTSHVSSQPWITQNTVHPERLG